MMNQKHKRTTTKQGKIVVPQMRRFKRRNSTDQAYVRLNGKRIFLGSWNTEEAAAAYKRTITEWAARGCIPEPPKGGDATIAECVLAYKKHMENYYRTSPSSLDRIKYSFKQLTALYGYMQANEFTAVHLRAVRESMINEKWARKTINERIRIICNMLKYCASLDMISPEPYHKAITLESLRKNRSAAKETTPIRAPEKKHIDAVLERVNKSVAAMIRLQMLTGCRPGEITKLKREDINTNCHPWEYELDSHKTSWRGRRRVIFFGEQAQQILKPFFLMRKPGEYLFQPADYYQEKHEQATVPRRDNQKQNARKTDRTINPCYDTLAYCKAIGHACEANKKKGRKAIPRWTPNQLRHYAAENIRQQYGKEKARALLGHTDSSTTEIYLEDDLNTARAIMSEVG